MEGQLQQIITVRSFDGLYKMVYPVKLGTGNADFEIRFTNKRFLP